MARIFRSGNDYCSIESGHYLAFLSINGSDNHVIRRPRNTKECLDILKQYTGRNWKWIA